MTSRKPIDIRTAFLLKIDERSQQQPQNNKSTFERAQIQTKTALREAEAQRLAKVRSEYMVNMAHEIRTSLNAVLSLAQLGLRNADGQPEQTFKRILESGHQLLNSVNDIDDLSKIEAGQMFLEDGSIILGRLLDRVIDVTAIQARDKGLIFRVKEALDLPRTFRGDTLRLSQVLIKLVSNAIKFTAKGSVSLTVTQSHQQISFCIRDSGIGMCHEQIAHLFKVFEQADGSTTHRFDGTGFGLLLSQHLVQMMGGDIRIFSQPQEGSTFEVRLPLRDTTATPLPLATGRIHLLGVEQVSARQLVDQLQAHGYEAAILAPPEAFTVPCSLIVMHTALLADAQIMEQATLALNRNQNIAFLAPAGNQQKHPSAALEEPLRLRHVLALLSGHIQTQNNPIRPQNRLAGLRILVAENNALNQLVLEDMLRSEGAELLCVDNGRKALEIIEIRGDIAFDLVLTDIQMPDMDGFETARRLRTLAPGLPVIALTAHAMPEEQRLYLEAGMLEHLCKPINLDLLVNSILRHVSSIRPAQRPSPQADGASTACIEWSALTAQFGAKTHLLGKLIAAMLSSCEGLAAQLRKFADEENLSEIAFIAHKLKGGSATLKAHRLNALAIETESKARHGSTMTSELARQLATAAEEVIVDLHAHQAALS